MKTLINEKGMTLVEVIVMAIIVSVAMLGLHISILYAETQMVRNYHERKAYLLASGQLELCQQKMNNQNIDRNIRPLYTKASGLGYENWVDNDIYIVKEGEKRIIPTVTASYRTYIDMCNGTALQYVQVTATVSWMDPTYKSGTAERTKSIKMQEDFYSFYRPDTGGE